MSDTAVIQSVQNQGVTWREDQVKKLRQCTTVKKFKATARASLLACSSKEKAAELLEDFIFEARSFQKQNPTLFECKETRQLFSLLFLRISSDFNYGGHNTRPWQKSITHYLGKSGMKNLREEMTRQ